GVRLGEVEDQVRLAPGERDERLRASVDDLIERLVAELAERLEDLLTIELLALAGLLLPRGVLSVLLFALRLLFLFLFPEVVEHRDLQLGPIHFETPELLPFRAA